MSYYDPRPLRTQEAILLIIAFAVLYFFLSMGRPVAAEPREVRFFVDQPACVDRKVGYVTLAGRDPRTEALHRVWICGLGLGAR